MSGFIEQETKEYVYCRFLLRKRKNTFKDYGFRIITNLQMVIAAGRILRDVKMICLHPAFSCRYMIGTCIVCAGNWIMIDYIFLAIYHAVQPYTGGKMGVSTGIGVYLSGNICQGSFNRNTLTLFRCAINMLIAKPEVCLFFIAAGAHWILRIRKCKNIIECFRSALVGNTQVIITAGCALGKYKRTGSPYSLTGWDFDIKVSTG